MRGGQLVPFRGELLNRAVSMEARRTFCERRHSNHSARWGVASAIADAQTWWLAQLQPSAIARRRARGSFVQRVARLLQTLHKQHLF